MSLFYLSPLHYPLSSHPFSRYSHFCLPSPFSLLSLLSHLPSFHSPISPPFSIFPLHFSILCLLSLIYLPSILSSSFYLLLFPILCLLSLIYLLSILSSSFYLLLFPILCPLPDLSPLHSLLFLLSPTLPHSLSLRVSREGGGRVSGEEGRWAGKWVGREGGG